MSAFEPRLMLIVQSFIPAIGNTTVPQLTSTPPAFAPAPVTAAPKKKVAAGRKKAPSQRSVFALTDSINGS